MKLLQWHIFKSLAITCLAGIGLFTFVLALGNAIRDNLFGFIVSGQLPLGTFLKLLLLLPPFVITYALPMGTLTGILLVLGRMSAENEITAMRAAGLSLARIAAPVFFFAVLGVATAVVTNFYYMPRARVQYHEDLGLALKSDPMRLIIQKTFVRDFPGIVFYVGSKEGSELRDLWVWELDPQGRVKNFIRAEKGIVTFDDANNSLILTPTHAQVEARDEKNPEDFASAPSAPSFDRGGFTLPLDKIFTRQGSRIKNRVEKGWLTFGELIGEWRRLAAPIAVTDEVSRKAEAQRKVLRMKLQIFFHEKFCTAFSVLSFAIIGIPLSIKISRKETSANLGLAVALAMSYYFLTVMVGWMDKHPDWRPDLLMWVPNIFFQALGLWMFKRADR